MEIKTKLNIGDEIFFIGSRKIVSSKVQRIKVETFGKKVEITYLCNEDDTQKQVYLKVDETDAYKSKQELIKTL